MFTDVKSLAIPEGEVTKIEAGGVVLWSAAPSNLFNKNDADIHDKGRFNSSLATVDAAAGQLITGFINAKPGDVFTVKTDRVLNATSYTGDVMYYDSSKTAIGKMSREIPSYHTFSSDYLTGTYKVPSKYQVGSSIRDYSGTVYARFCVTYTNKDNIVITKA